jgi:hypothetical protein
VSDIQEMRERLRRAQSGAAATAGRMLLWAACAVVLFLVSLWLVPVIDLTSRVKSLPPSPSIPTWSDVQASVAKGEPTTAYRPDPAIQAQPANKAAYEGKSAKEIGAIADEVCFQRTHARYPHWSKTPRLTTKELQDFTVSEMDHFDELLRCLLSEAPQRYCSSGQRRMIAAEISMYFRGIAYGNRALDRLRNPIPPGKTNPTFMEVQAQLAISRAGSEFQLKLKRAELKFDSGVLNAIEWRLRDGLLTKAEVDTFAPAAPEAIRERLARVQTGKPTCPVEPWWAFWR